MKILSLKSEFSNNICFDKKHAWKFAGWFTSLGQEKGCGFLSKSGNLCREKLCNISSKITHSHLLCIFLCYLHLSLSLSDFIMIFVDNQ